MDMSSFMPEHGFRSSARAVKIASLTLALGLPASLSASSAQDATPKIIDRVAVAQAKPAARPAAAAQPALKPTAAPIPGTVAEATPAAAPPAEQNSLGGAWKVNWIRLNKVTSLNIGGERAQPGIVGFDSVIGSLAGTDCKGGGFAAKTLGGVFPAGGDVNMVGVADYVRITTQCEKGQVWLEALGVAGKPLQWVGRAVMIDAAGARSFESVVLMR